MTNYNQNDIEAWVEKYAPRLYFHPDEKYFGSSVEWYLQRTTLFNGDDKISPASNVTDFSQYPTTAYIGYDQDVVDSVGIGNLEGAICYVNVAKFSDNYIDIEYFFFSPFNGGASVQFNATWKGKSSVVSAGPQGSHEGDWEHITVRVTSAGDLFGVYYSCHSHGTWYGPQTVPLVEDTHPVVYVALQTHASYAYEGTHTLYTKVDGKVVDPSVHIPGVTIGGADVTKKGGAIWDTWDNNYEIIRIDTELVADNTIVVPNWVSFVGKWGGPYDYNYSISEIVEAEGRFIKAFIEAEPFPVAVFAAGVISTVQPVYVTYGSAAAALVGAIITGVLLGGESMGPTGPAQKKYYCHGEVVPFTTTPTKMKNGSTTIKTGYSPGLAMTESNSRQFDDNQAFAFYADTKHNLWCERSSENGIHWKGRESVTNASIHSSVDAVFFKNATQEYIYVFYEDKNSYIQYTRNGASGNDTASGWHDGAHLPYKPKSNTGVSATVLNDTIYLVFRDGDGNFQMVHNKIGSDGVLSSENWEKEENCPIGSGSRAGIAAYNQTLIVSYRDEEDVYVYQCYFTAQSGDNGPVKQLNWGNPTTFSIQDSDIPDDSFPQPVVINDVPYLIFRGNTSNNSNIDFVKLEAGETPNTLCFGDTGSLEIPVVATNKLGLASCDKYGSLMLAIREDDSDYLYTAISYLN